MLTSRSVTVYKAAVFVSAFLTFSMQPLVAKRLLPVLGGAPAVWNTCLLFFQLMLLAGYLLADRTVRVAPARQRVLHPLLLVLAGACLPMWLRRVSEPPAQSDPAIWLLGHLALTVGVPFLVLCSNTTVVQSWYARRSAAERDQAYTLYRWSNAGSLLGLLAYPVLVEPALTIGQQQWAWVTLYAGLVVLIVACARATRATADVVGEVAAPSPSPTARMRARWVVLAFVPSSFTISVTSHVTSDLAAVPLLWVVPLALYLCSFVLAFGAGRRVTPAHAAPAVRVLALVVTVMYFAGSGSVWWLPGITSLVFLLAVCLLCHGRLSDLRPDAGRLSAFYLWLAAGGAMGGIFNALVAPHLFYGLAEYPLGVMMAGFLLPALVSADGTRPRRLIDVEAAVAVGSLTLIGIFIVRRVLGPGPVALVAIFLVPALVTLRAGRHPRRFGLCLSAMMIAASMLLPINTGQIIHQERTFFGVLRVALERESYHVLLHGTTSHGQQKWARPENRTPLGYYHHNSPVGQIVRLASQYLPALRVGVVGLGTGTLAAYARPTDAYTFYEIDPSVEWVARDPRLFSYLKDSAGTIRVKLGDARLSLARESALFDVLVLDAFSSDAIPVHLLTREAFELYKQRLAPHGVIAVHISNRYLDLRPSLMRVAVDSGLDAVTQDQAVTAEQVTKGLSTSRWVAMARKEDSASELWRAVQQGKWFRYRGPLPVRAWTDDYSNLVEGLVMGFGPPS
jgi:spermidine synthase